MSLKLMYITNNLDVALIAQKYGVDRVWIDLETIEKDVRQKGIDSVKSHHQVSDIVKIKPHLTTSEMLVRVNSWYAGSVDEINAVIKAGADMIMLPYWKTAEEVQKFIKTVDGRCKTTLLLETKEAVDIVDDVLEISGINEIHIGLNDLHLSYDLDFMFELLTEGTVEKLCTRFVAAGIPYGFGGIAKIGDGAVPAEKIIMEHYRLGSTRAILSRTFCDTAKIDSIEEIDRIFNTNMIELREFEKYAEEATDEIKTRNREELVEAVNQVVAKVRERKMDKRRMPKTLTTELLNILSCRFGNAFYLLESESFEQNYKELTAAFKAYYPKFNIAYSYKTNYTPKLVQIVDRLGGYAEVVSDMEMDIALRVGVRPERIIWNGPVKNGKKVKVLLLNGGTVNIDSIYEIDNIRSIAESYPDHKLNVGVRVNYDVGDGVLSRFGFDVDGEDFDTVLRFIKDTPNIYLINLQAHFAKRTPEYWAARTEGMLKTYDRVVNEYGLKPERIDIGGGIYGKMPESLRLQLGIGEIAYDDYASRAAKLFADHFKDDSDAPYLFIEPGSAVAGDCMRFVSRIETIKTIRGKTIATVTGSQKNISMSGINPPMEIVAGGKKQIMVEDADIVGFTCIEGDVLQKGYNGAIGVGDFIVIGNCGSYSLVMKPPFILPNFAVLDIYGESVEVIKRAETFDDLLHTFSF